MAIKICSCCGAQMPDYPFAVGDRVRHFDGREGTVEKVGQAVTVLFEENSRGVFDAFWFRVHPTNALTKI